jgi:alkylation response protein AidB-like acyl-CoA dehydrogenase
MDHWPPHVDAEFVTRLRASVASSVAPFAHEIDRDDRYPAEVVRALAREGYNTLSLPKKYGGAERPLAWNAAVFEEVSSASAAVGASLITIYLAQKTIDLYGTPVAKDRFLPRFAEGLLTSFAMTEASHGSDVHHLDTKAVRTSEGWVLDGKKSFVTSSSAAELFVILAETERGVSSFVVPRETPGVSTALGKGAATFGLRNGPHLDLALEGVELPTDYLLGEEGRGVKQAATTLDHSRTLAAAISVGIARAAFDGALAFAKGRVAFEKHVIDFQGIQWYFADMLTEIDAARLLVYESARALDDGREIARFSSEAKLFASRVAAHVAAQAIQICGAQGMLETAPFGRYLRDAKAYEIAGGSSEILRNTIARQLLT